jgi:hypothetical protein
MELGVQGIRQRGFSRGFALLRAAGVAKIAHGRENDREPCSPVNSSTSSRSTAKRSNGARFVKGIQIVS